MTIRDLLYSCGNLNKKTTEVDYFKVFVNAITILV